MKRSEINNIIRQAEAFFAQEKFVLPPFAQWSVADWQTVGSVADPIREAGLGWDVADFGRDDFKSCGLVLFTLRNGLPKDTNKCYAEKIMMVGESQLTPWHFHRVKTEDIINRSGGDLVVEVGWTLHNGMEILKGEVEVLCDGIRRRAYSREAIVLRPGESITLPPQLYHQFYGAPGTGTVLVGEVSNSNDDKDDNCFLEKIARFPNIEEDDNPYRLLCNEYPIA